MSLPKILTATCLFLLLAPLGRAGVLPLNVSVTDVGDTTRYAYGVVLTSDSVLRPGDYFTIFDFAGYVPGTEVSPVGFSFSTDLVGPTPPKVDAVDRPGVPNLTWTYNGPEVATGQTVFGTFGAESVYGGSRVGDFSAQTHTQLDGTLASNITETTTPVPCPNHVPEPAAWMMALLAVPAIFLARRRLA